MPHLATSTSSNHSAYIEKSLHGPQSVCASPATLRAPCVARPTSVAHGRLLPTPQWRRPSRVTGLAVEHRAEELLGDAEGLLEPNGRLANQGAPSTAPFLRLGGSEVERGRQPVGQGLATAFCFPTGGRNDRGPRRSRRLGARCWLCRPGRGHGTSGRHPGVRRWRRSSRRSVVRWR